MTRSGRMASAGESCGTVHETRTWLLAGQQYIICTAQAKQDIAIRPGITYTKNEIGWTRIFILEVLHANRLPPPGRTAGPFITTGVVAPDLRFSTRRDIMADDKCWEKDTPAACITSVGSP